MVKHEKNYSGESSRFLRRSGPGASYCGEGFGKVRIADLRPPRNCAQSVCGAKVSQCWSHFCGIPFGGARKFHGHLFGSRGSRQRVSRGSESSSAGFRCYLSAGSKSAHERETPSRSGTPRHSDRPCRPCGSGRAFRAASR